MHSNVQSHLINSGVNFKIRNHNESKKKIKSPSDFAEFLGYETERIAKTLFLKSGQSNYLCFICPALVKADLKDLAKTLNLARLQIASASELTETLDYPPMGVSPLGVPVTIVIDKRLLSHPSILVGGGKVGVEIELSPQDLIQITNSTLY